MTLNPAVGYKGGKRRLLPALRPHLGPERITLYIEPYVGMGAVYLDLRHRGYRLPAILADANECVADFWRLVHSPTHAPLLIEEMRALSSWPTTAQGHRDLFNAPVYSTSNAIAPADASRIARFLWLTNYSYGNNPPSCSGSTWTNFMGSKLTSAAKWGKTFPWADVINRVVAIGATCSKLPTIILPDASMALGATHDGSTTYADPPYYEAHRYAGTTHHDALPIILNAKGTILLSELPARAPPPPWQSLPVSLTARMTQGKGAAGTRTEALFIRHETPAETTPAKNE